MRKAFSKKTSLIIASLSIVLSSVLFFFRTTEKKLFPGNDDFRIKFYTDVLDGGNSTINFALDTSKYASFEYELGDKIEYPYAGMYVQALSDTEYFDISGYETIVVSLKAEKSKMIPVNIRLYCEDFSTLGNPNSYISYIYNIEDSVIDKTYEIPIEKFVVPEWWYTDNGLENGSKLKYSFTAVQSINIEQGAIVKPHFKDKITVYAISLKQTNHWYLYVLAIGLIIVLAGLIYDYSNRKKMVFVPYQSTPEMIISGDVLEKKILDYIASNYANPELGLTLIHQDTGISDTRISAIIKTKYNQSFKQYLNNIRMTEAKRLLKESSASISEIAYSVGYSNVTHFNRVFKTENGTSPGDYRKSVSS